MVTYDKTLKANVCFTEFCAYLSKRKLIVGLKVNANLKKL